MAKKGRIQLLSLAVIIEIIFLGKVTQAFCAMSSYNLNADLTRAVVRSSDYLKQSYMKIKSTSKLALRPYNAAYMFATLRIAGHTPDTLLSNFKNGEGESINETLKSYLDSIQSNHGNLSSIPVPRLALITQAVIAICEDPENFYGYNLTQYLLEGFPSFPKSPGFSNVFGYSLAVIALCNSGKQPPQYVVHQLMNAASSQIHGVDTDALILTALSCVSSKNLSRSKRWWLFWRKLRLARSLLLNQNKTTGGFGNQYSSALAIQALRAFGVHTILFRCNKAMKYILSFQKEDGSFGNLLANIQVTPALLGESLISLKNLPCPPKPTSPPPPKLITVTTKLVFNVTNLTRTEPPVTVKMPQGATAANVLDLAAQQNHCYLPTYRKFSIGRYIVSICGVVQDNAKRQYWIIYVNGAPAQHGVDDLIPNNGDRITFKYVKLN